MATGRLAAGAPYVLRSAEDEERADDKRERERRKDEPEGGPRIAPPDDGEGSQEDDPAVAHGGGAFRALVVAGRGARTREERGEAGEPCSDEEEHAEGGEGAFADEEGDDEEEGEAEVAAGGGGGEDRDGGEREGEGEGAERAGAHGRHPVGAELESTDALKAGSAVRRVGVTVRTVLVLLALLVLVVLPPADAAELGVAIQGFAFNPASVKIAVGDSVLWTNKDGATHTATSDSNSWTTGTLGTGASKAVKFDTAGTFPYHCGIHPSMKGTVVVGGGASNGTNQPPLLEIQAPAPGSSVSGVVTFRGAAKDPEGKLLTGSWTIGSEPPQPLSFTPPDGWEAKWTATGSGSVLFKVRVRDPEGAETFREMTVSVSSAPGGALTAILRASPLEAAPGANVELDGSASTAAAGNRIVEYRFEFGDGASKAGPDAKVVHAYATAGSYTAKLVVKDSAGGLSGASSVAITVKAAGTNPPAGNGSGGEKVIVPGPAALAALAALGGVALARRSAKR